MITAINQNLQPPTPNSGRPCSRPRKETERENFSRLKIVREKKERAMEDAG